MQLVKKISLLLIFLGILGCNDDDVYDQTEEIEEVVVIPTFGIIGTNLTTGSSGNIVTWDDTYEVASTINLQETLGFQFGFLKNTVGSELAIAAGFPDTSEFIFYDVSTSEQRTIDNYFFPENPVGNSFVTNTQHSLLTYYLDDSSSCCNIYLNTFSQISGDTNEVYLGNADIAPVQLNVFASNNRTFATAVDTFTGVKKLFIHDANTGESLGVQDVSQYGGFIYNNVRDELYLFNFNGEFLNHTTLNILTSTLTEPTSFPEGFEINAGFNSGQFSQDEMIFKDQTGVISSTYSFVTDTIDIYNSTDLINIIFEETGRGVSITNTAVDLGTGAYIVMGTYLENGISQGITVALTRDREVILVAESGDVRPDDVVFL